MRFGHYFQNNSENRNKKTGYIDFLGHTLFKYDEMRLNSVSTVKAGFFCYCCLFVYLFFVFIYCLFSIGSFPFLPTSGC